MGLIKAAVGAAGGVLADQWKEYFYCEAMPADVLVTKAHKKVSGRSSNKHGSENIISNGSVIAVNDGQCMLIVEQGKVVDVCAEPGEYTYDMSTEPSLFCGDLGEGIKSVFQQIGKRFTFGGEAPKDQRVYFVNTKELVGNKYGTPNPVPFRVVDNNSIDDIDYSVFQVKDGDALTAEAILDRFENKLEIKGAVYRPGIYQFGGTLNTVRQLVEKAEGLMGDAFTGRAVLHRERENLKKEVIQVDIKGIMDGTAPDVPLQRNDVLYIPSIHDLEDVGSIMVYGEVARPGEFAFADNTTLEDIIIQAGGLMESASTVRVDVSRRIKDSKGTEAVSTIGQMYSFSLKDGFVIDGEPGFVLQPYDQVYVRKSPAYQEQVNVQVTGEVLYEGDYALTEKSERLSDLIKKAGGVTPFAYIKGARLSRRINADERKRMETVLDMAKTGKDSIDVNRLDLGDIYYVGIDLEKAMLKPGSSADIVLREGDVIEIPEYNNTVRISGAVMYPNTVSFEDGKTLKYYIEQAGGYGFRAKKSKVYIVYMNGQVKRAKKGSRELIQPGCEVIVPVKEKSNWSLQNTLSIATTSASLATMIASIANILK